jgi:hypothetical protein
VGISKRLAGSDDGCQVALHELYTLVSTVSSDTRDVVRTLI